MRRSCCTLAPLPLYNHPTHKIYFFPQKTYFSTDILSKFILPFSNIFILFIIIYNMMNTIDIDKHIIHIRTYDTYTYHLTYILLYDRLYIERNNRMNNNNLTDKDMINMIEGIIRNISEPNAKGYVYTPSVAVDLIYSMIQHCKESRLYKR